MCSLNNNTKWRDEFLNNEWLNMIEEIAVRKLLTGNWVTELRNLGTSAYKIKCKWEYRTWILRGIGSSLYVGSIEY
jgi:hypothetical protein